MRVDVAIKSSDLLGEGPVWSIEEQALYWVDIQGKLLQRWDAKTQEQDAWEMPSEIGSFAFRESGGLIVALRSGIAFWDVDLLKNEPIFDLESNTAHIRFNDGKCDRQGRFWVGTMDEESPNKRASLYRLGMGVLCQKMMENIGISNGLGWSPDNRTFYYTDSFDHTIYAFDFDLLTGEFDNKRVFINTPPHYVPDGLTVDTHGFVWSANWDGWKITRYDPDGHVDTEVTMPVQRPTSCTFGGPGLSKLFVTSAKVGLSKAQLEKQPLAGDVFVIETGIQGIPEPKFRSS